MPPTITRLIVVGEPRSGTTLLIELLAAQPSVAAYRSRFEAAFTRMDALGAPIDGPLSDRERHLVRRHLAAAEDAGTFAAWIRAASRADVDPAVELVVDRVHRPLRTAVALLPLDPELAVVQLVRDPRDVALSRAYANPHEQLEQTLLAWKRAVRTGDRVGHPRFVRLRFEDLVGDPTRALAPLAAVLGRPLDPARLEARAFVHNSSFDDVRARFDPAPVERWRGRRDLARVRLAGWACAAELARLGYAAPEPLTRAERRSFARRWLVARSIEAGARLRRRLTAALLPPLD